MKSDNSVSENIQRAAQVIAAADAVLVCAGAGMGVDSGLPDFRGKQGFWRAYPVIAKMGLSFEEMANPRWFETDPHLAWAFYGHRLNLYRTTTPHAGFRQLLEICSAKAGKYFVFTSNVDGQFQKAGFGIDHVVECHGSIHHLQCTRPCSNEIWETGRDEVRIAETEFRALEPLPKCKNCSALARPNILMFGDWTWIDDRTGVQESRLQDWLEEVAKKAARLTVIELGAGSAIPTVRHFAERVAAQMKATLIRINPQEHNAPQHAIELPLGAAEAMASLAQNLPSKRYE
jgi:NAD-dependent SIR2 family protein deacetylase